MQCLNATQPFEVVRWKGEQEESSFTFQWEYMPWQMGRERIKNLVTSGEGSSARPWPSMDFEVDSMSSRKNTSVKCSSCGARLVVPPQAQTICCAACRATTNVGRSRDPVRQAVGIVKAVVLNICSSISSLSSSSWSSGSSSYGYPTMGQPSSFPRVRGKKRAVLVGISYAGRQYELKGTVNDVNCMRYMLTEKFGFPAECILVLTGTEFLHGTKSNNIVPVSNRVVPFPVACRRGEGPEPGADEGELAGGDAVAGERVRGR